MARPRREIYSLDLYLDSIRDGDICNNADVQRNFVWGKGQINELIVTVLTDEYIPPIILGEEESSQLYIADGGQRSTSLLLFKEGNYKITSSVENPIIPYKKKTKDKNGKIIWEDAVFDVRNKTYEKLPPELKRRFNKYQLETVVHEKCDMHKISKYIKKYNNYTPMNINQKAFTHIDKYAKDIRRILDKKFFLNHSTYTETEKLKGTVERVIIETIMCTNHLNKWKKAIKSICSYLNCNAEKWEFEKLENNLTRLEDIITEDIKDIFNSKDSFIFLSLFDKFTAYGIEDIKFAEFLREFKYNLRENKSVDGMLFDEIDKEKGTKDKSVILKKLEGLEGFMREYLNIGKEDLERVNLLEFVKENGSPEVICEDIEQFGEVLDMLTEKITRPSKLLDKQNRFSLTALVAYSFKNDIDLEGWIVDFFGKNDNYIEDQKKNYLHMKQDLEKYICTEMKNSA